MLKKGSAYFSKMYGDVFLFCENLILRPIKKCFFDNILLVWHDLIRATSCPKARVVKLKNKI